MPFSAWAAHWRHGYANVALTGGNLALLLIGLKLQSAIGWQISLGLVGLTSFWAWQANLRRYRAVADTPTSRIGSAPQGYVEVVGRGRQPPGATLRSPLNGLPCLWYRYRIERRNDRGWEHVESGMSHDTFGVDDGSGLMLIDPDGAEILTSRKQVSHSADYRRTEWTLIEGETLYALGEHVTLGGPNADLDRRADLDRILTAWKQDRAALLARFDADGNGEIDLTEWEGVRRAASDAIDREHADIRLRDGVRLMRRPPHGRPFLVANRNVAALVKRFHIWSWAHLAFLLAALAAWTWVGGA